MLQFLFSSCLQNLLVHIFNIIRSCYKLTSTCAQQHVNHMAVENRKFLTLLNHLSSWACVWILCGMCVKDKDYSICDGKYTVGWLEENRRNGEKLSEQKRTRKPPHMCGLTVSHSDQIPLLLASGQPWSFLQVSFNTQAMTQGLSTGVNKELNVFGLRLTLTFSGRWTGPNPTFCVT